MSTPAAILARVSDPGQHSENQVPDLRAWAKRRGLEVVVTYEFQESAWKGKGEGGSKAFDLALPLQGGGGHPDRRHHRQEGTGYPGPFLRPVSNHRLQR